MATIDIQVPDIGDFDAVGVIEVLVKPGDTIAVEQSLITVESDKASMEIPSSHAGVVKELKVKLGDQVKQGSVVLTLEVSEGAAAAAPATVSGAASAQPATVSASNQPEISAQTAQAAPIAGAASYTGAVDMDCDVLVLGGGPGLTRMPCRIDTIQPLDVKALRAGEATVILPDQVPSQGDGVWALFFGRPAYTMTLVPRLATMTGVTTLFFYGHRLPKGEGFIIKIRPLQTPFTGDKEHDAALMNQMIESLICEAPEQYLWSYNRYKKPAGVQPPPATC